MNVHNFTVTTSNGEAVTIRATKYFRWLGWVTFVLVDERGRRQNVAEFKSDSVLSVVQNSMVVRRQPTAPGVPYVKTVTERNES